MPNITFAVPDDLYREMRDHPEIRWAEIARSAIRAHLQRLYVYDRWLSDGSPEPDGATHAPEVRRANAKRAR
jgi:hypothetical protein